ncbi:MAG: HupE/UreJ family protein [Pseudomonadales bacterium]|nr:HupE/UreJ family protein [Pseudomonadales bacterium]
MPYSKDKSTTVRLESRISGLFLSLCLAFSFTLFTSNAYPHALAPSLLQLDETVDGVSLVWKTATKNNGYPLSPELPRLCKFKAPPVLDTDNKSVILSGQLNCAAIDIVGRKIGIKNISENITPVLVRFKRLNGAVISGLINARKPVFLVPEKMSRAQLSAKYLELGARHLLAGYDHVLFVLAMVLLIKQLATLVKAVTFFTLGHSVSLALSTFNIVSFPTALVEILIAASIVAMAVEICNQTEKRSLFERHAWVVATTFGLLHGLGFASVLSEFSLPRGELTVALFSFNLGIELGQLLVIACCLLVSKLMAMLKTRGYGAVISSPRYLAYGLGSISAFWVLERTQLMLISQ